MKRPPVLKCVWKLPGMSSSPQLLADQSIALVQHSGEPGRHQRRNVLYNRARRQSGFPTFIPCQRQDANVLPKRRQLHQGDKLCDVSTVPLVARWPVFLARGSDADGEPHRPTVQSLTAAIWEDRPHAGSRAWTKLDTFALKWMVPNIGKAGATV